MIVLLNLNSNQGDSTPNFDLHALADESLAFPKSDQISRSNKSASRGGGRREGGLTGLTKRNFQYSLQRSALFAAVTIGFMPVS